MCLPLPAELPRASRPAGSGLWRVHQRHHDAKYFHPSDTYRFNAPAGEFGVCYLGENLEVAFLETVIRGSRNRLVPRTDLVTRVGTPITLMRELSLLQLHSESLVALGCPAEVPHRVPYDECQRIALETWRARPEVDGIEYRSRWDDGLLCVALFDRAAAALGHEGAAVRLNDLDRIRPILRRYDVGII